MAAFRQCSRLTSIPNPARSDSSASVSRPKARRLWAAWFSSQDWAASVRVGETRLQGGSKKQATAPKSEPNAPSFFLL